jgi:hypothetical protein
MATATSNGTVEPTGSFRALRPEYREACKGNPCAAHLLDLFTYWTGVREKRGDDEWFYRSIPKLRADLFDYFGKDAIRAALALLVGEDIIEVRERAGGYNGTGNEYRISRRISDHSPDSVVGNPITSSRNPDGSVVGNPITQSSDIRPQSSDIRTSSKETTKETTEKRQPKETTQGEAGPSGSLEIDIRTADCSNLLGELLVEDGRKQDRYLSQDVSSQEWLEPMREVITALLVEHPQLDPRDIVRYVVEHTGINRPSQLAESLRSKIVPGYLEWLEGPEDAQRDPQDAPDPQEAKEPRTVDPVQSDRRDAERTLVGKGYRLSLYADDVVNNLIEALQAGEQLPPVDELAIGAGNE